MEILKATSQAAAQPPANRPFASGTCKAPHLANLAEERDGFKRLAAAFEARCKELEQEVADLKRGQEQMALEFGDLADECRSLETKLKIAELAHDKRLSEIEQLRQQLADIPQGGCAATWIVEQKPPGAAVFGGR